MVVQQRVEQCDDGNLVNTDFCSNACLTATCSDGAKNGNETDTDCGGACQKCGVNKACGGNGDCNLGVCTNNLCLLPKSCNELKVAQPGTPTGSYNIDPDGGGGIAPLQVRCEMAVNACGYTMVRFNDGNLGGNRIYKWNEGCGLQGGWNDGNNTVQYTGWVICSTNDC